MQYNYTSKDEERFWSKVDRRGKDECWEWKAGCHPRGYGVVFWRHKPRRANRVSYEIEFGFFDESLNVLHTCDNPSCCNPAHLFLGTQQDNVDDAMKKHRMGNGKPPIHYGEKHPGHKLSDIQVSQIRLKYLNGETQTSLANAYSVSIAQICNIVHHKHRT